MSFCRPHQRVRPRRRKADRPQQIRGKTWSASFAVISPPGNTMASSRVRVRNASGSLSGSCCVLVCALWECTSPVFVSISAN